MSAVFSAISRGAILTLLIFFAAMFMLNAAKSDSAIMDELAHIPAGYSYVSFLDYRLNPEHPPLIKALAAIPLLFQKLNFPSQSWSWTNETNGQWSIGSQFLYESSNDTDRIIFASRIFPILLTLALILLVYFVAKTIIGKWWALLPAFLTAFSPNILAHGHYVTTDIGVTLGILAATIIFLRFLFRPSAGNLIIAGAVFGLAQLTKFSALLLIPYFLILALAFWVAEKYSGTAGEKDLLRYLAKTILIFTIGFLIVFLFYLLFTWNYPMEKQVADTAAITESLNGSAIGKFTVAISDIPFLRAFGEYLLGLLMVIQGLALGNTLYFLGEITQQGSVWYFPMTFLLKESPGSLSLIIIALAASSWAVLKSAFGVIFKGSRKLIDYLGTNFAEFAMIIFIAMYWILSLQSNLNIGVRHIIPTLPFIYILATSAIKKWVALQEIDPSQNFLIKISIIYEEFISISLKTAVLIVLIIWAFLSPIIVSPHFLSYFNIFSGGTGNGYKLVVDSNYDWGQDLKRLKSWVDKNIPEEEKIAVDYFGGGSPKYYLGDRVELWEPDKGNPANSGIKWLAASVNNLQIAKGQGEYLWLENLKIYDRAGTSIFIYKLVD